MKNKLIEIKRIFPVDKSKMWTNIIIDLRKHKIYVKENNVLEGGKGILPRGELIFLCKFENMELFEKICDIHEKEYKVELEKIPSIFKFLGGL